MYGLLGFRECMGNLRLAARLVGIDWDGGAFEELKDGCARFLALRQPPVTFAEGLVPDFVDDPAAETELLTPFIEPAEKNDALEPITEDVIRHAVAARRPDQVSLRLDQMRQARADIHRIDPSLGALLDLMIHRFFCVDVPGNRGGSSSRAIGVIWVNTPDDASPGDLIEFVVHELTHHAIFLDARLHDHYTPAALDRDRAVPVSAIRGVRRPFPCVFDSLLVGIEILWLREHLVGEPARAGMHPATSVLLSNCIETVESIRAISGWEGLLTDRGHHVFDLGQIALARRLSSADGARGGRFHVDSIRL